MAKFVQPGTSVTVEEVTGKHIVVHTPAGGFSAAMQVLPPNKRAKDAVKVTWPGCPLDSVSIDLSQVVIVLDSAEQRDAAVDLFEAQGAEVVERTAGLAERKTSLVSEKDAKLAEIEAEYASKLAEIDSEIAEVEAAVSAEFAARLPQPEPVAAE